MPFDDLPPEIIRYIFSLCCGRVAFRFLQERYRTQSRTSTQVTLLLVCSRWKEVALNTSALWGDVMVEYDTRSEEPIASFQFVQNWLNRAEMTPTSLAVCAYEAWESEIAAISQILLTSSHITNLELESVECHRFLLPTHNSHYLETLNLILNDLMRQDHTFPRLPEMPSLKELQLSLNPGDFRDLTNIYLIPWHQFRVFTLRENPWPSRMLFNILQRCKSLVECTLSMKVENKRHNHNIALSNLESLVLDLDIRGGSADPIVWSLLGGMPTLKSVTLRGPLRFQPERFDDLSSGAIGPQLEEICFDYMTDEEIALMLQAVGQRYEKAKTRSDIKSFASITCRNIGSNLGPHKQRAKQCGEAFNAHVAILPGSDEEDWESDFSFDSHTGDESDSGPNAA